MKQNQVKTANSRKESVNVVNNAATSIRAYNKVRISSEEQVNNAVIMESDFKLIELRQKIASNWAAPEWSGAAALRASLVAIGTLSDDQIDAAIAGAARKSGENLQAITPSVHEVVEYITANYSNEFQNVCGCAVPAAGAVRCYAYTNLSVSTITANSVISDYVTCTAVPAGASASAVVAAVMSVRVLIDVKRRIAAARAAARASLRDNAANLVRSAARLGVSSAVLVRYINVLAHCVPVADNREEKRLRANLSRCWASLRSIENAIVLAAPAGCFGAAAPIADSDGGWCFPASLPASAPAKCRKLWAKRVRVLSAVTTLETLLSA